MALTRDHCFGTSLELLHNDLPNVRVGLRASRSVEVAAPSTSGVPGLRPGPCGIAACRVVPQPDIPTKQSNGFGADNHRLVGRQRLHVNVQETGFLHPANAVCAREIKTSVAGEQHLQA